MQLINAIIDGNEWNLIITTIFIIYSYVEIVRLEVKYPIEEGFSCEVFAVVNEFLEIRIHKTYIIYTKFGYI